MLSIFQPPCKEKEELCSPRTLNQIEDRWMLAFLSNAIYIKTFWPSPLAEVASSNWQCMLCDMWFSSSMNNVSTACLERLTPIASRTISSLTRRPSTQLTKLQFCVMRSNHSLHLPMKEYLVPIQFYSNFILTQVCMFRLEWIWWNVHLSKKGITGFLPPQWIFFRVLGT